jgi:N-acetylmuramoyl-L-alanine amidase
MKLCIDPGHGMSNTRSGVFDSGATAGGVREADIALAWGLTLKAEAAAVGIPVWMTRYDNDDPDPVGTRDDRAKAAGCTHFIAIHCNDADSPAATGVETYYRDDADHALAAIVQAAALAATGLRTRGLKPEGDSQHNKLAVFSFPGPCALVEIGFITNAGDRAKMLSRNVRIAFADAVIGGLRAVQTANGKG